MLNVLLRTLGFFFFFLHLLCVQRQPRRPECYDFLHVYHINLSDKKHCDFLIIYSIVQISNRGAQEVK